MTTSGNSVIWVAFSNAGSQSFLLEGYEAKWHMVF